MNGASFLGLRPLINAAGPVTRLGGHRLAPPVVAAMTEAAQHHVSIELLQERAGAVIATATGAEAGYVTSGASAGLALAGAACIAKMDIARMEGLPSSGADAPEIVMQRAHRSAYDHALRLTGARIVEVGTLGYPGAGGAAAWQIDAAIGPLTVAVAYSVRDAPGTVPLETVVKIAHAKGLPVIVDAAATLPPVENLTRFVAAGADLVAYSGGKGLRGPQASGLLCGRADLIRSVALQHQDMDVHPATWRHRSMISDGVIAGVPTHGVGRPMKVGKETIVGLLAALEMFLTTDHDEEVQRQHRALMAISTHVRSMPVSSMVRDTSPERHYPILELDFGGAAAAPLAAATYEALTMQEPAVYVRDYRIDEGILVLVASALSDDEVELVNRALDIAIGGVGVAQ